MTVEKLKQLLKGLPDNDAIVVMKVECYVASVAYGWKYIIPSIEYRHKYWYLWEIAISWWKKSIVIELCRKDWNKHE